MLTANDLDVLRYHLSEYTNIEKIITFQGKIFVGRGLKQNKPVPTSSLIFIIRKATPTDSNEVEIVNYKSKVQDFESLLVQGQKNVRRKKVLQNTLRQNVDNWNFITKSESLIDFVSEYKRFSESFDIYRLPEYSIDKYKDKFYFDVGFILDKKIVSNQKKVGYYEILDFKNFKGFSIFVPENYYPNNKEQIKLTRSNQGHITLDQKYSIVWRIKNPDRFFFTDRSIIFNMGTASIITSNSKREMSYIFSLLNSPITRLVLETYLKIESEKEFQVAILPIKKYIRVPRIIESNEYIKKEVIQLTDSFLELEKLLLSDLVDFSGILQQKFDNVSVEGSKFVLEKEGEKIGLLIKRDISIVRKIIETNFGQDGFGFKDRVITLPELISLPVIDYDKQKEIKNLIDDLVFCLYFNINIPKNKLSNAKFVRSLCINNKFYKQISIN